MIQSQRLATRDTERPFETIIAGISKPLNQITINKKSTPVSSQRESNENFDTFIEIKIK
ncbi:hypothetical protein [Acetivibrio straminisolvens]|uniref:Uncharacterized protein n=1 Tax=Acetivibrio straminisolvens JCM 21531 TaxID=1294263 RepID=W4V8L7_9FIRM|nr:hypothetical protein [Acetivibrio straminisolvens]GAE89094.1 hypothetical protein JCM21531_2588 [Acetivibrio straminisolvens JCM 21531]